MATSVIFEDQVEIPLGIGSLADFRRWAASASFPERGRIDYVAGHIEVDMSPENLFSHGTLKVEVARVLANRVKRDDLGHVFSDRTRVSCPDAGLSAEPDVVYLSYESIDENRVRLFPKATAEEGEYVEIEGPPDVAVEIVSDSSVIKDTQRLPIAYFEAGVREFWLLDARGKELIFHIHRRGKSRFEAIEPDADGFQASAVYACRFRLDRRRHAKGHYVYDLLEKS
jgi:Uma2 family endonuclease